MPGDPKAGNRLVSGEEVVIVDGAEVVLRS